MIFRFVCFLRIWVAFTRMAWGAAFSERAEFTHDAKGFSVNIKEQNDG